MITLKKSQRYIENAIYKVELVVEELHCKSEGTYTQFYVTLDRNNEEIAYYEPNDLEVAIKYYNNLEEYVCAKANLYDEMQAQSKRIWLKG